MAVRIARIETFLYRAEVRKRSGLHRVDPSTLGSVLRVEDSDGAHGWGEVWCNFPPYSADNKLRLMETVVGPGRSRVSSPTLPTPGTGSSLRHGAGPFKAGNTRPIAACLAGVDLALWI